ncbi:hypothetical protein [Fusobacterium polymorphum]|uniref:hypothetical protein n=1 Tax=Fusobacterium nucleatum subsp. polymorphum TaxID=76857 RepID=UPI0030086595
MKKIIIFFLILLSLIFIACGNEKNIGEFIDKEKISSKYNIEKEDENSIEFADKDEDAPIFKIFTFQKMLKIDYNNPNKLDKMEEYYLSHDSKIIYKDEETLIEETLTRSDESDDIQDYGYNIHTFDNSKTELSIIISVGATRKLSESELVSMLKEAKSFIKK